MERFTSVFGPVKTPQGWNVGQVLEVEAARPLSYDEAKQNLRARLTTQRAGGAMTSAIVLAALSVPMFIFGRWGQLRAVSLAARETGEERRRRKERSIRNGAIAWQCVAGFVLLIAVVGMVP